LLAGVIGFVGCAGDEVPPASPSSPSPPPVTEGVKPASPESNEATAPTPVPPKTEGEAGKSDLPPLEEPKTSAEGEVKPVSLNEKQLAAIKKLPAEEQDAAIKQAVCPVSGGKLGSMDMPIKITAEGRTFYLCCDGCEDDVKADPQKVIAKLDKK
jgi:hypothetical protein